MHSPVVLSIFTLWYNRSPECFRLAKPKLCPRRTLTPRFPSPGSRPPPSPFRLYDSDCPGYFTEVESRSVCLSVTGLLHGMQCPQAPSMLQQASGFPSLLRLNVIPSDGWTPRLSIHLLMDFHCPLMGSQLPSKSLCVWSCLLQGLVLFCPCLPAPSQNLLLPSFFQSLGDAEFVPVSGLLHVLPLPPLPLPFLPKSLKG